MQWESRPVEIANLLNPAFCALVLRDSVKSYHDHENTGMPFILAFLLLPLVLHRRTRDSVPQRPTTSFAQWIEKHNEVTVGFDDRVRELSPYTREAIAFGLQHSVLVIAANGGIVVASESIMYPSDWRSDSPASRCITCAKNVGRWFAEIGDESTICRLLGVRP